MKILKAQISSSLSVAFSSFDWPSFGGRNVQSVFGVFFLITDHQVKTWEGKLNEEILTTDVFKLDMTGLWTAMHLL